MGKVETIYFIRLTFKDKKSGWLGNEKIINNNIPFLKNIGSGVKMFKDKQFANIEVNKLKKFVDVKIQILSNRDIIEKILSGELEEPFFKKATPDMFSITTKINKKICYLHYEKVEGYYFDILKVGSCVFNEKDGNEMLKEVKDLNEIECSLEKIV